MTSLGQDVRYAIRQLLRTPAFTCAAIITLALGIAVNTAFFSIVNAVVFRPARSMALDGVYRPSFNRVGQSFLALPHFRALERTLPEGVEAVDAAAFDGRDAIVHIPGRAERMQVIGVSGGHAQVFRLVPQVGRFISPDDDRGAVPSAVISDRVWREWFGGDRAIVERENIRINNDVYQVVGVAPIGYRGASGFGLGSVDVWVPLSGRYQPRFEGGSSVQTVIRLRPGVSPGTAVASVKAVLAGADEAVAPRRRVASHHLELVPAGDGNPFRAVGVLLLWLSTLVLVAACANLANMLYARGVHRRAEMAVRQALGASAGRIFRLLLAEAVLVGMAASTIGLALAVAATWRFGTAFPLFEDRAARVTIDLTPDYLVFAFALAAGVLAALIVGGASAWRASRMPPMRGMAVGDAATSVTHSSRRTRLGLVALQVGAAVVLLMAAGVFYQETKSMMAGTPLFDTAPLASARIDLARHGYTFSSGQAFLRRLDAAIADMPEVESAAIADGMPGGTYMSGAGVTYYAERTDLPLARYITTSHPRADGTLVAATPGFLRTLGLRITHGRDISHADVDGAPLAVVISETMARALWPDGQALGKRLMFGNEGHWRTVVGLVSDPARVRAADPRGRRFNPERLVIAPLAQRYPNSPEMVIASAQARGEDPAAALARWEQNRQSVHAPREMLIVIRAANARGQLDPVRQLVTSLDPAVAVFDAATVDESILAAMSPRRAGRLLLGALGFGALTIATLGIYGVVSFLVARRKREFGIRMALGAQRGQVLKMVIDDALHLLLVGLFVGVFAFAVGERLLQSRRYGLMPNEISTWAIVLVGILTVGLVAAFIPARRAASINPNVALRDL